MGAMINVSIQRKYVWVIVGGFVLLGLAFGTRTIYLEHRPFVNKTAADPRVFHKTADSAWLPYHAAARTTSATSGGPISEKHNP